MIHVFGVLLNSKSACFRIFLSPDRRNIMDQNNRNNRNDKNRSRRGGMWSIVLWALLLTIAVNYLSVMLDQARSAESSCEIAYSELRDLVQEGKVKSLEVGDSVYTITPVDGYTYTDADGNEGFAIRVFHDSALLLILYRKSFFRFRKRTV